MVSFEDIIKKIEDRKNKTVVIDAITNRIYDQNNFSKDILTLTSYLKSINNEKIIIRENNSYDLLIAFFATMFSNKIIIPVDPEKEEIELARIRQIHFEAKFVDVGEIRNIMETQAVSDGKLPWDQVNKDRLYLITYTSGSTGEPKGVMHSIKNLFLAAYAFGEKMKYSAATVMGHCMPMTYMAGILNTIIMPYVMDGSIVILPRFSMTNAFEFWNRVKLYNINTLWISPTMLRIVNLIDKKGVMREYFHDVCMKISVGTAPLDSKLRDEFEKKYDTRLYQSYGLSETLFISTEVLEEQKSKHTVGQLLPDVELLIEKDGEIEISVPWLFIGYTNIDTKLYIKDNKYISGDLGKMVGDNLIITGRKKDLIVKGGYNINPRDIEKLMIENNMVYECAVVPVNINGEELIGAYIVSSDDIKLNQINEFIVKAMGKHNKIDYMEKVMDIPKNLNGKIDKTRIAKELEQKYDYKV